MAALSFLLGLAMALRTVLSSTAYPFEADPLLFSSKRGESVHTSPLFTSAPARSLSPHEICTFDQWTRLPNPPGKRTMDLLLLKASFLSSGLFRIFTIISVLSILVILVVFGNALVIAAVVLRRRLRSATGLLILSLAVADLLVGWTPVCTPNSLRDHCS